MPRCSAGGVTVSDSSDTYRRIGLDSEKLARALPPGTADRRAPGGERDVGSCSPIDTDGNLPWLKGDISRHFSLLSTIVRQARPVKPVTGPTKRVRCASKHARSATFSSADALGECVVTVDRRSHQGREPGTVIPVRKLEGAEVPKGDLRRFCVWPRGAHWPATEASWGRTAPDVRGGRANGARPS
jgi:hypothetical protein